jgi:hypothetical protein
MSGRIHQASIALAILALVLGACGGGAGKVAQDADRDPEKAGQYEASDGKASAAPGQGADDNLSDLEKKRRQATFMVAYKWTTNTAKGSSTTFETWFSKPPRSRVDFGEATAENWLSQFGLENGAFSCFKVNGKPTCSKWSDEKVSAQESSTVAAFMTAFEGILTDKSLGATRDTRTIAGQRASCARATNILLLGLAEITVCFAGNGVPLLLDWKAGSDVFRMEATSYSSTVSDKDFDLPAKPQDTP